jgi:hypothetical protein
MVAKQIKTNARIHIPLGLLSTTGAGAVQARTAQGEPALSLPTAATSYVVQIPLTGCLTAYSVAPGTPQDPFGFRLESMTLYYLIGAVNLTAHTLTFNQEVMAGGAARAAAAAVGGTLSFVNNGVAGASLPTAFSANAYLTTVVIPAPFYLSADNTLVHAEWTLGTGAASGTASIYGIILNGTHSIIV